MDIQSIANNAVEFTCETFETAKTFAIWGARRISAVTGPLAEKAREFGSSALKIFESLLKSGPVGIFALSGAMFVAGIAAFKMADRKAYEDEPVGKTLWKIAGIMAFVGATVFTGIGMAAALS